MVIYSTMKNRDHFYIKSCDDGVQLTQFTRPINSALFGGLEYLVIESVWTWWQDLSIILGQSFQKIILRLLLQNSIRNNSKYFFKYF